MYVFLMFIHVLRIFMMLYTATSWFRHQFHTVEVWGSLPRGIGVGQSGTGTDFSPSTSVFPLSIIPPVLIIGISFTYHPTDTILASDSIIK